MPSLAALIRRRRRRDPSEDPELKQFRELMTAPDPWADGFGLEALIGGPFMPPPTYTDLATRSGGNE